VIRTNASYRPGARNQPCAGCGKPITKHPDGWKATRVVVVEEQTNWFRGDDIVRFYHHGCEPKEFDS